MTFVHRQRHIGQVAEDEHDLLAQKGDAATRVLESLEGLRHREQRLERSEWKNVKINPVYNIKVGETNLNIIMKTIIMGKMEMVLPDIHMMNKFIGTCLKGPRARSQLLLILRLGSASLDDSSLLTALALAEYPGGERSSRP